METLKQYADRHGISYEAVRRQVRRYAEELDGHIMNTNRQQVLDEYAAEFLDQHRGARTAIVDLDEETQRTLMAAHEEIRKLQARIIELQDKALEMAKNQARLEILEQKEAEGRAQLEAATQALAKTKGELEALDEVLQKARLETADAQEKAAAAEQEAGRYKRTIFGLYKKED